MVAPTLLSTEEYLSSSFEYDKEYVEGELVERSMPTFQHGWLQTALSAFLFQRRTDWGIETVSDTRIRIAKAVFRVADICVVDATSPVSSIIRVPPLCVIEILSPDDRLANIRVKAREYHIKRV